jgi:3-methyladenine DNA glycosylase AlkD
MHPLYRRLRDELVKQANPETKIGAEKYFRGVITFHGIKTPNLNAIYKKVSPEIKELELSSALSLSQCLLASPIAEEKGLAILILKSRHKELGLSFLDSFEPILCDHVYDWGTADGLSGKVFRHLIERSDAKLIKRIVSWRSSSSLWMQRMAAVSFVNLARHGNVTSEVLQICKTTIRNPERFVQLGTGWVLRELWLAEPETVEAFIETNYQRFSREGLRYAIEKMPKKLQKEILDRRESN